MVALPKDFIPFWAMGCGRVNLLRRLSAWALSGRRISPGVLPFLRMCFAGYASLDLGDIPPLRWYVCGEFRYLRSLSLDAWRAVTPRPHMLISGRSQARLMPRARQGVS